MHDKGEGPSLTPNQHNCGWLSQPRSRTSRYNLGPGPQGVLKVELLLQYKAEDEATLSQPATKEEEEEEK